MVREGTGSIRSPGLDGQRAPLPTGEGSDLSTPEVSHGEKKEVLWAVVIRWATVHSGPLVSAPTVRFHSVDTDWMALREILSSIGCWSWAGSCSRIKSSQFEAGVV